MFGLDPNTSLDKMTYFCLVIALAVAPMWFLFNFTGPNSTTSRQRSLF